MFWKSIGNTKEGNEQPEVADFIKFVNDEIIVVINSVFSKEAIGSKEIKLQKKKFWAIATGNKEIPNVCIYCDEMHKLKGCERFMEKTLKERIKFLEKKNFALDFRNQ